MRMCDRTARRLLPVFVASVLLQSAAGFPSTAQGASGSDVLVTGEQQDEETALIEDAVFGNPGESKVALERLVARGEKDVVPSLILASRYRRFETGLYAAISMLTGENIKDWHEAMLWQEAHPEVIPHESFKKMKLAVFTQIDPQFLRFLGGWRSDRDKMDIRLEEIAWGGVQVDGIPSLDNPKLIEAAMADYLLDDDLVFGVSINGDTRAYPLRIMGWHEMFNEIIGGVPVALAYCTLCGAGILFETQVEGREEPFIFGSSGFLYRSNKLMFDRETDSLWNQFTGEPVTGPLRGSGIALKIRPVAISTWKDWKNTHPDTKVLSLDTGHRRDYGSGIVYNDYFSSPDLMFPALVDENYAKKKDYVYGIRDVGVSKAWRLSEFEGGAVINDQIGGRNLVLVGDAETRTVRAYDRNNAEFVEGNTKGQLHDGERYWQVTENELLGPDGEKLPRVPGHIAYWFAWENYFGLKSELYQGG